MEAAVCLPDNPLWLKMSLLQWFCTKGLQPTTGANANVVRAQFRLVIF